MPFGQDGVLRSGPWAAAPGAELGHRSTGGVSGAVSCRGPCSSVRLSFYTFAYMCHAEFVVRLRVCAYVYIMWTGEMLVHTVQSGMVS